MSSKSLIFSFKHLQQALLTGRGSWAVQSWAGRRGGPGHLWRPSWCSSSWCPLSSPPGSSASHSPCQESSFPLRVRRNNKHAPPETNVHHQLGLCLLVVFLCRCNETALMPCVLCANAEQMLDYHGKPGGYIIMERYAAHLDFADLMQLRWVFYFFLGGGGRIHLWVCAHRKVSITDTPNPRPSIVLLCVSKKSDLCRRWHCFSELAGICSSLNFNHTPPYCTPVDSVAASGFDSLVLFNFWHRLFYEFLMLARYESVAQGYVGLARVCACVSQCRWAGRWLTLSW